MYHVGMIQATSQDMSGHDGLPLWRFNRSNSTLLDFWKQEGSSKNRPNKSSQCKRSSAMENLEYEPNPEVVPFQPANFIRHHSVLPLPVIRSSTILKRVPIPKRHQDTFGGYEYNFIGKRGVMLHTDRYQIDFIKSLDGMTQRERLQAGFDYMEAMRGKRRRREMVPHRAQLDLIMGGKQIEFEERFDITREIQKLKSIAMPKHAKDLFHGRGIHLPQNHLSLHPRHQPPVDDDDFQIPVHSTLQSIPRRSQVPPSSAATSGDFAPVDPSFLVNGGQSKLLNVNGLSKHKPLPTIRGKSDTGSSGYNYRCGWRGRWRVSSEPVSLDRERHEVNKLSARLGLLSRINRDVTSLTKSTAQAPTPSRDRTWQADQKLIAKGLSERTARSKLPASKLPVAETHMRGAETSVKTENEVSLSHPGESAAAETVAAEALSQPDQSVPRETTPLRLPTAGDDVSRVEVTSRDSKTRPRTDEGGSASVTPHPLRATSLITSVPLEEQDALRQTFQRLDTDADGHLKYNQLKTQLPKKFTREQERFTEEVYNLTNSITFFGVDEFMVMNRLSQCVENLTGRAAEAFETLDFTVLSQHLLKYIGLFDAMDKGNTGKISLDSLQQILSDTVSPMLITDSALWDEALDSISADYSSEVSKVVFIAHIPLFLSLETAFK
ncbi:hypothetical protein RRG08_046919 [Elysia crispata]|uniref:EF-hand domain-containing protein n=1 Tax=Elysia crispata TaxID=231223 RepID=A0AAE1DHB6_9GAST|nr:hypothetical protein RRG08_046919 [Elysia crispata]